MSENYEPTHNLPFSDRNLFLNLNLFPHHLS